MRKLLCLFTLLFCVGCKERMKECGKEAPAIYTAGYDSSEVDSIRVSQYQKGSNFSNKIGDIYFLFNGPLTGRISEDTFRLTYPNSEPYFKEYENFDWRYTVLSDGNVYDVTRARRKIKTTSVDRPADVCASRIVELTVNGKTLIDEDGIQFIWITKP